MPGRTGWAGDKSSPSSQNTGLLKKPAFLPAKLDSGPRSGTQPGSRRTHSGQGLARRLGRVPRGRPELLQSAGGRCGAPGVADKQWASPAGGRAGRPRLRPHCQSDTCAGLLGGHAPESAVPAVLQPTAPRTLTPGGTQSRRAREGPGGPRAVVTRRSERGRGEHRAEMRRRAGGRRRAERKWERVGPTATAGGTGACPRAPGAPCIPPSPQPPHSSAE